MSVAMILLPLFVLVAAMLVGLLLPRIGEKAEQSGVPGSERALTLALLFSLLTVLALFTRKADIAFLILAWIFVAIRVAAAFPALFSSKVRAAVPLDLAGGLVLALMWVLFALAILLNI